MLEPERLQMAPSALAGSVLYGLYTIGAIASVGKRPSTHDIARVGFNIICATMAGLILAYFAGPELVRVIPFAKVLGPSPVGVIIGALSWEILPLAFRLARDGFEKIAAAKIKSLEGRQ